MSTHLYNFRNFTFSSSPCTTLIPVKFIAFTMIIIVTRVYVAPPKSF